MEEEEKKKERRGRRVDVVGETDKEEGKALIEEYEKVKVEEE